MNASTTQVNGAVRAAISVEIGNVSLKTPRRSSGGRMRRVVLVVMAGLVNSPEEEGDVFVSCCPRGADGLNVTRYSPSLGYVEIPSQVLYPLP